MTTPVITATAPPRPTPASDSGGSDSAEPFASALDGALGSAGRAEVDGAGAQAGGDPAADQEEAAPDGATQAPAESSATTPGSVVAALWALLTGAGTASPATDATAGAQPATGAPGSVDALPPGLAVAAAHGGAAVAHGVRGTQPGKLHAAASVAPADATATDGAPVLPAPGAPVTPPPTDAAVRAAVEALAAAGVSQIVTDPAADAVPGTAAPSTAPVGTPATAPSTGDGAPSPASASTAPTGALPVAAPGSGGTAADGSSGSGTGTGEQGAAGTDAVQTSGQTAPTTTATPVGRPEATTGTAVEHPVSGQIARSVAVLRGAPDGSHTMTVVLTPDSLGPVEVSVTVSKGTVELTLRGAHEHGRAALLDAVPDLRRDLEAAGLTCSRLDVDRGSRDGGAWSSSQQFAGRPGEQGPGSRGDRSDRSDGGARPWARPADRGDGPSATTRTASGLDVRV